MVQKAIEVLGIVDTDTGTVLGLVPAVGASQFKVSPVVPNVIMLTGDYTLTANDGGKKFECTVALVLTVPSGLAQKPEVVVTPPPTGNLTVRRGGSATLNGGTADLLRDRTDNPAGIVIRPYVDPVVGYAVSGS